jgi:basic membrane protein A and related proteins
MPGQTVRRVWINNNNDQQQETIMIRINRRGFIAGAGAAATLPMLGSRALAADPIKIGYIYVGPVDDGGWTTAHERARQQMMKALGDKITSQYVDNVPESPDAANTLSDLANQGCKLIYATSFGFMEPAMKVAADFPDVNFEICTGFKTAPNVSNYNGRFHEGRSVCGTIAGHLSKAGVGGYLGTFPVPEVVAGINAFTLAARKVNPNFKTKVVWINTWFDPAKEGDAARALGDAGVDVMTQHTDSPAAVQYCQSKGIPTFGQDNDQSQFGPDVVKTSTVLEWGDYYTRRAQAMVDGSYKAGGDSYEGIKEGLVQMAPLNPNLPPDVADAANKVIQGWKDGSYDVFAGPIKDQQGNVKVPEGSKLSYGDILGINWLVEGVEGTLPS